ncbi:response regulator [Haloarcula litorea]|uniref:response regulator n=1 Tax=Haloarcula litorea TaxID=3032579 RepID=UPI0023E8D25B|nr:response regulator [Halomicroarcula sp. GDY20]
MPPEDPLSILYVDDDPALCSVTKEYLERPTSRLDCTVLTETDPERAIDRVRSDDWTVDCVVSDYDMPAMDGIELVEAVRETRPELPVLLFTGTATDDIAPAIVEAGVTDYLAKGRGVDGYTMLLRRVEHAVDGDGQFDPEAETELDGVAVVGRDERFDEVDDHYASLYDYDAEELTGEHWTELHPDAEVEHIRTHVLPVVESGGQWSGRSEGERADGSTFTESKLVTALDDGRLLIAVSEFESAGDGADGTGDDGTPAGGRDEPDRSDGDDA